MPVGLYILFFISWIIVIAKQISFWLFYIQSKQNYKNRIISAMKQKSFYALVFSKYKLLLIALILPLLVINNGLYPALQYSLLPGIVFLLLATYSLTALAKKAIRIPKYTTKFIVLQLLFVITEVAIVLYTASAGLWKPTIALLLLFEILQPFIVLGTFIALITPNDYFTLRPIRQKAIAKIKQMPDLTVIGITGSYGKTSVKEFLHHILASKYETLATPEHINVDTGIAKHINTNLKESHKFFVVEMGAYVRGEIKSSCEIAQPQIGVLTALGKQHLELFGSQENLIEAKMELGNTLLDDGTLYANFDNDLVYTTVSSFKKHPVVGYGVRHPESAVKIDDLHTTLTEHGPETSFSIEDVPFHVALWSEGLLNSLVAAISVSLRYMTLHEAAEACRSLTIANKAMFPQKHNSTGAWLIDDTYNASLGSVEAALKSLDAVDLQTKAIVFKEIIDLGKEAKDIHESIAKHIGEHANTAYILPGDHAATMKGYLRNHFPRVKLVDSDEDFKKILSNQSIIIFEGFDAGKILSKL